MSEIISPVSREKIDALQAAIMQSTNHTADLTAGWMLGNDCKIARRQRTSAGEKVIYGVGFKLDVHRVVNRR